MRNWQHRGKVAQTGAERCRVLAGHNPEDVSPGEVKIKRVPVTEAEIDPGVLSGI